MTLGNTGVVVNTGAESVLAIVFAFIFALINLFPFVVHAAKSPSLKPSSDALRAMGEPSPELKRNSLCSSNLPIPA